MSGSVSRIAIIWAIIKKDLKEFTRDKLWGILSALGLVMFAAIFWLLPSTVNETITLGVHQTGLDNLMEEFAKEQREGLELKEFNSSEDLIKAVAGELKLEKEVPIGIDFPKDFLKKVLSKEKTTVQVYIDASVPKEISRAMSSFVREIAHELAGNELPITEPDEETIILGEDRAVSQVPLRDRMRSMLVFFLLITESLVLGSLISGEVQSRTVTALLVTPARTGDVLAAKALFGTFLAFGQALLLLIAVQALGQNALLLLTIILLGALMASGIGMITGAAGKDFMGTLFVGMVFLIPMMVPAIASIFPGTASAWVRVIPSYGVVQGIIGVTAYEKGWAGLTPDLGLIIAWVIVIFSAGLYILKRKVETL